MTILVTGGKGTTAKPLADLLKKNNVPFLVASRSSSGQGQVRFNWSDESTYDLPFQATTSPITGIYMVAPTVPDVFQTMKAFIDFARAKGVKRFVLLSATPVPMGGPLYGKVHEYLTQIDVEYGVVRPTWFMSESESACESKLKSWTHLPFQTISSWTHITRTLSRKAKSFRGPRMASYLGCQPKTLPPSPTIYSQTRSLTILTTLSVDQSFSHTTRYVLFGDERSHS